MTKYLKYTVVMVFVSSILTLQQKIYKIMTKQELINKKYDELFEIIVELYEGLEVGIEENDYSDFLNDRTHDEMIK